jgi:mRNA interferase MazF
MKMSSFPVRGEIYWVKFDPSEGAEIKKTRPGIVISNDIGNRESALIIIAPITSTVKKIQPFQVEIALNGKPCKILLNQIRTIDKLRLGKKITELDYNTICKVDDALRIVLAL